MTTDTVLMVMQQGLEVIIVLVSIVLLPALVVGLLVSMFQAATQINEMTLSFIPKLLVTLLTLIIGGPWMLNLVVNYSRQLIENIPMLIG
jgi:flagellar biosynthesis protein FliQ